MLIEITNCTQCHHHKVENDPDPDDWFCADDMRVKCTLSKHAPQLLRKGVIMAGDPYVTVACRPYNLDKECEIPSWCPLNHDTDS